MLQRYKNNFKLQNILTKKGLLFSKPIYNQ